MKMNNADDARWSEVDGRILACDPLGAHRSIRELTGVGPEEADAVRGERVRRLRAERGGEFAWAGYPCEDYLASEWAERGCWDEPSQAMVVVPCAEVREADGFLVVGGPGVDGIAFGYRKGLPGLWAYRAIDRGYVYMAPTVAELVEKWTSGALSV